MLQFVFRAARCVVAFASKVNVHKMIDISVNCDLAARPPAEQRMPKAQAKALQGPVTANS
jgi:hypothetical protein